MVADAKKRRERRLQAASGYLDLNMPEHALRELDHVENPEAVAFEYHRLRGEALRAAGQFTSALEAYERALAEQADSLDVLMGLAWCYKRTDQLFRAIDAMDQAYQAHPKEAIVLYNMACYYSLAGDKTQSLSWLGRALRMEPGLRKLISEESDFDSLRDDPDFQYITTTVDVRDA